MSSLDRAAQGAPAFAGKGLSTSEAEARYAQGLANVDSSRTRTDGEIIRANTFTFFNLVLAILIVTLFVLAIIDTDVGRFQDAIFVGIVVVANVVIATYQEIRATGSLRRLAALTAPNCTVVRDGREVKMAASHVVQGDLIHLQRGDQVVADGPVVWGKAEIDESLLSGESEPCAKGEGAFLLSGSFCTAGGCYYQAGKVGAAAYAFRLTSDARQLVHRLTPLQYRFQRVMRLLLVATGLLGAFLLISYQIEDRGFADSITATTATLTTIVPQGLLLAITVAFAIGAVRVSRAQAIVQDINAVEALNYVDVVCLDKTGTITANRLKLEGIEWLEGSAGIQAESWLRAYASATYSESQTTAALLEAMGQRDEGVRVAGRVPFSSERRWGALSLERKGEVRSFVLGAPEAFLSRDGDSAGLMILNSAAVARGLRSLLFAETGGLPETADGISDLRPVALLTLSDVLRPEVKGAFDLLAEMEIEPKLISGDNAETVAALAAQIDVDLKGGRISGAEIDAMDDEALKRAVEANSVFGRISPEQKARIVGALRNNGHFVAMIGDGANDVRALHAADVAVAMVSGTETARSVANIVLLNDSFQAFIKGLQEARTVLGNVVRLSKLFLAKSLYASILIAGSNMLALDFPFLPRQGTLTSLLALGIPAVIISITRPPPGSGNDYIRSVIRFILPASIPLALITVLIHLVLSGFADRPLEESQTLVSLILSGFGIILAVEVIGFEEASRARPLRPALAVLLGVALLGAMLATVYSATVRDFFAFTDMGAGQWAVVILGTALALGGQYLLVYHWRRVLALLTAGSLAGEIRRGRSV